MGVATVEVQGQLIEVEQSAPAAEPARAPVGEEKTFRPYDPGQVLLMAPVLQDWVPEGDLAHFVSDLVEDSLDLSAIYASYESERGYPPYDPRLMLKLLIYGYATGTPSSRKLEQASYRDVAVRMLCADQHPDYRSIARFRRRHLEALAELFCQALRLCGKAGLVKLGTLALDGTKLRANASRHKAMSYERMSRAEAQLEGEIAAMRAAVEALLADAEQTDQAEDERYGPERRGDELPSELARRETRLRRIREAKAALEAEEQERERARQAQMRAEGREPRKADPDDEPPAPKPTAQRNFTDPDSRIMKTSDGAFQQCFNAQAVVDGHAQVIVACDVSDQAPDARQLEPALEQLQENLERIDAELPEDAALLADAGYFSEHNFSTTAAHGLDAHIATGRFKHSEAPPPAPRGRSPRTPRPSSAWPASFEPRRAAPSTPAAKRSSSPCSARSTPSKTAAGCSCAGRPPPAPSGASTAPSTTCSSSTAPAGSASSPPAERPTDPADTAGKPQQPPTSPLLQASPP
jgi:transposase